MPSVSMVVDHSPHHPAPAAPISTASNLVLIDNYDSFTWNVYQYLCLEGAHVTVFRNDQISLDELIAKSPTQLVLSPGPGHPDNDTGICDEAIHYFSGKIPILGVCLGQQSIISTYGGKIQVTGEILHGKTSPLRHDSRGVYQSLPQDIPVTRYHSLAGTHATLPSCLEVSSWIALGPDGGKGVIMGVRHREYVVEGVQFHPESILTEGGRTMLKNFLGMTGGYWSNSNVRRPPHSELQKQTSKTTNGISPASQGSILEKIYAHRRAAVASQREKPSQRFEDLQAAYSLNLAPPQISFSQRIRQSPYPLSLMAEIKRASPSKGIISLSSCAPSQARDYAEAGASVISVLTEPEWFKGSLEDLRMVRQSLNGMVNRPAVLRKEFIFDEYQILEARLAGADSVLLIVKMLDADLLKRLYSYSRKLGMEPLVEVNTPAEMEIAVDLGAEVIGVNNRDLTSFEVDLETTSRLMDLVPNNTVVAALSGISGPQDVTAYKNDGVKAILVGEALMRATDTSEFIAKLLGGNADTVKDSRDHQPRVKICGTRTPEAARTAIEAGAGLIGMILVHGKRRFVRDEVALEISEVVRTTPLQLTSKPGSDDTSTMVPKDFFKHSAHFVSPLDRALLVGVFLDQPLAYVLEQQRKLKLDIVQFHGSEPIEWANLIPVPVLRRFKPGEIGIGIRGYHALPLLDSGAGSGIKLDLSAVKDAVSADPGLQIVLAGGLDPETVTDVLDELSDIQRQVAVVDVSSGVETNGEQDLEKIRKFVRAVSQRSS